MTKKETKEKEPKDNPVSLMQTLTDESPVPPRVGDSVEGLVVALEKGRVFVELHPFGVGIIFGREFLSASDILRKVKVGDSISAKVVDALNDEGYIELSLMEARQALIWSEAEKALRAGTIFELPVKEANKGGLMIEWQGLAGFLPASQLKPDHYPRVEDGDKGRILEELKRLVGEKIRVAIITANPEDGKLIFSEKVQEQKGSARTGLSPKSFAVGDVLEGEVTGIVEFGVFVRISDDVEGLVHISELDWGLVEDPKTLYKAGEVVKVKIIEIKDNKISLSIKALKDDPWKTAGERYKKDSIVSAVVIKHNKHGALASIEEGVAGLVHVSEFASIDELRKTLELGRLYSFKITLFDPTQHRMTLSYKQAQKTA
jgi:small subunit ribosomal protein S1